MNEQQAQMVLDNLADFARASCTARFPVMTDDELEHWSEFYHRHELARLDIRFSVFIQAPYFYAKRYCGNAARDLPA